MVVSRVGQTVDMLVDSSAVVMDGWKAALMAEQKVASMVAWKVAQMVA